MKDRLVVQIDSELKKRVQIYGINNSMNITEVTEKALYVYMEEVDKTESKEE